MGVLRVKANVTPEPFCPGEWRWALYLVDDESAGDYGTERTEEKAMRAVELRFSELCCRRTTLRMEIENRHHDRPR